MNIKITRLALTNFKCFRSKEFTFDSDVNTIRGRNGVGKTTIADAILWCLFGKNAADQATFSIKTHDEQGNDIPHLEHSVEMTLETIQSAGTMAQGLSINSITLRRCLKETWVKKRGATDETLKGHTTDYFVNGEAYTAKDYEKYISSLVSEDIFRAITNPQYFPSLKWQQQREFLTKMVGEVLIGSDADAPTTEELTELIGILTGYDNDIVKYRKHLAYQIKQIKDKLDRIPVRLEEQNKAIPECLDWDALKIERDKVMQEIAEIEKKYIAIKSGNADDVRKAELRKQLDEANNRVSQRYEHNRAYLSEQRTAYDQKITELSTQFNQLLITQRDLEAQLQSFDALKKRCQDTLFKCESDAQKIREEWANNLSRKLQFSDTDCVCPTCGLYLPEEQVADKRQKAEANLNADKARIKSELTQRAEKVKATRAEAEKTIADYDQKRAEAEKNLSDTKEQINQVFSDKAKQEKEKAQVPSLADYNAADAELLSLQQQANNLQSALLNFTGDDETVKQQLADLQAQNVQYAAELQQLNAQLATRVQYDRILALIDGINTEQHDLVTQLSKLEQQEDVAREYQDRMNAILEERVNKHFSLVRWRMFRTVNNGGDPFDEPFCECYVDGAAYHDGLNQAARLNAGLDIINTLCRHYNVSAPIVLDNAESTINIIPTIGQQIRLQVTDTDLQII